MFMKNFVLLLAACFTINSLFAKIPEKLANAFHLKYASATNVKWKNNVINYTVTFKLMNAQYHATYDKKGEWLQSEKKIIMKNDLPEVVKNSFDKSDYASWTIQSLYEEFLPKEQPRYHIRAAKGSLQRKNIVFDFQGHIIKGK